MNEQYGLIAALLIALGQAFLLWVRMHAAGIVGYLDEYWSAKSNEYLEAKAVLLFREHVSPIVPENLIRRAVRAACRNRKRIRLRAGVRRAAR